MGSHYSNNLRILVGRLETSDNIGKVVNVSPLSNQDFDVRVWNPVITPSIEVDDEAGKYASGDHGEGESIMGAQSATIEFSVKISPCVSGATNRPSWFKFAEACGCHVLVAGDVAGYTLVPRKSKDITTITIGVYDIPRDASSPAALYLFTGCMGNMTIGAEGVGKPWTATFSFTGKLANVSPTTSVPALTLADTAVAEKLLNYSLVFNGLDDDLTSSSSQLISTFQLDVGNEVSPLIDQGDPTGYAYYSITKRSPRFSCNPLVNGSFVKLYNTWKGSKTFSVALQPKPASDSNGPLLGITLVLPKVQQLTAAIASREGLVNWDLNLKALRNDGAESPDTPEDTWKLIVGTRP